MQTRVQPLSVAVPPGAPPQSDATVVGMKRKLVPEAGADADADTDTDTYTTLADGGVMTPPSKRGAGGGGSDGVCLADTPSANPEARSPAPPPTHTVTFLMSAMHRDPSSGTIRKLANTYFRSPACTRAVDEVLSAVEAPLACGGGGDDGSTGVVCLGREGTVVHRRPRRPLDADGLVIGQRVRPRRLLEAASDAGVSVEDLLRERGLSLVALADGDGRVRCDQVLLLQLEHPILNRRTLTGCRDCLVSLLNKTGVDTARVFVPGAGLIRAAKPLGAGFRIACRELVRMPTNMDLLAPDGLVGVEPGRGPVAGHRASCVNVGVFAPPPARGSAAPTVDPSLLAEVNLRIASHVFRAPVVLCDGDQYVIRGPGDAIPAGVTAVVSCDLGLSLIAGRDAPDAAVDTLKTAFEALCTVPAPTRADLALRWQ